MIRENSQTQKKTFTYEYDLGGNLVKVCEYPYTTGTLPTKPSATETGTFGQVWRDKLMKWNGVVMQYDSIGNMTKKGNTTFTWTQGRKLESVNNGKKIRYYYDHAGNRVKKTVDNVTTEYCMAGDLLVTEKGEGRRIWYYYDSAANPVSMRVSGKDYFYVRNLQNDVIALIDDTGETVVEYKYNSWGKILSITGSKAGTIGKTTPFRYRGYYYDEETGMYYLKNRYYDPEIRRFISADSYKVVMSSLKTLDNRNLFSYCGQNPINRNDEYGAIWNLIASFAVGAGVSIGCQIVLERKSLDEINWVEAVVSGMSASMNLLGIGNALTSTVIDFAGNLASNMYDTPDFSIAVINAATDTVFGIGLNGAMEFFKWDDGASLVKAKNTYISVCKEISETIKDPIDAIPHMIREGNRYSKKVSRIANVNNKRTAMSSVILSKAPSVRDFVVSRGRLAGGGYLYKGGRIYRFRTYEYRNKYYDVYI